MSPMPAAAARLVRRYYTYAGIYTLAASIIWGINTLFLLDAGLSVAEVFIANAAFSVGTVLFEIPTGVVADTIGRRVSFLLSLAVLASSTLAYVGLARIGGGLIAFSAVSVVMGLGYTFYSGAMEAWLVDGVRSLGFPDGMDRIFARAQIIGGSAMLVGTIGGGLLGQIDLSIPFVVRSALLGVLFILAFFGMHDIGFETRRVTLATLPSEATKVASTGLRLGWQSRPLRLIMIAGAIMNGFYLWAWYAWQPYFLELLEDDAVWVAGVVAALLALATMAGNSMVGLVARLARRRTTILMLAAGAFSAASVCVGLVATFPLALGFFLVAAFAMGITIPIRQALIHGMVASQHRATVVSFDSMISGMGAVGGQAGLGVYSERAGYAAAYVVGGAVSALSVPVIWLARRMRAPADPFEGVPIPEAEGCVPPGLPSISQVESRT